MADKDTYDQWEKLMVDNNIYNIKVSKGVDDEVVVARRPTPYDMDMNMDMDLLDKLIKLGRQTSLTSSATEPTPPATKYDYRRIAETLMRELVSNEIEAHVLLKDDNIRDWWTSILKEDKRKSDEAIRKEEIQLKKEQDKRLKSDIMSRLTDDEKRVLGLK